MDPDKMRQCMSLGYSAKSRIANTIGQCKAHSNETGVFYLLLKCYHVAGLLKISIMSFPDGNGFKTSTMRLGADVIVFSRCCGKDGKRYIVMCILLR